MIDQALQTRKVITQAVSQQFFTCFLTPQSIFEWWLSVGLATFFSGLYFRKLLGSNEYKYMIYQDMKEVCSYEREQGPITLDLNAMSAFNKETLTKAQLSFRHHLIGSPSFFKMLEKKAHLVVRLIDDHIGRDIMQQLVNKMLTNATNVVNERDYEPNCRSGFFVSVDVFANILSTLASKDITGLLDMWVYKPGVARLNASFAFNRKKNSVEIEVKQDAVNQKGKLDLLIIQSKFSLENSIDNILINLIETKASGNTQAQ
jgi:transcription initiation factor TFIID subunit 2